MGRAGASDESLAGLAIQATLNDSPRASADEGRSVVFIDRGVADYKFLAAAVPPELHAQVVVLATKDPLSQIARILGQGASGHSFRTVHLVSHGKPGGVLLGGSWVTTSTISSAGSKFAEWGRYLAPDATLLLYGCQSGAEPGGADFLQALRGLTGAEVAASSNRTGARLAGADWELEVRTGSGQLPKPPFSNEALAAYRHTLSLPTAPTLDNSQSPTLTAITEDITSTANTGTSVGDMIVPGSITDPDGPGVLAIAVTAVDNTHGAWEYTIDNGGTWIAFGSVTETAALLLDGTLTGASTQKIRFVPAADYNGSATLAFRAWDLDGGTSGTTADTTADAGFYAFSAEVDTASISVNAVNDAPVLDNTQSPALTTIAEDLASSSNTGMAIADLVVAGSITDPDGTAVPAIAVTAVDNTNGAWEYTTDNGTTWVAFGSVTESAALLLDGTLTGASTHKVRFLPAANYHGSATLTFRAWDLSSGSSGSTDDVTANGGSTAFSAEVDTASISVAAVNDAPVLDNTQSPALVTITEDLASSSNTGTAIIDLVVAGSITDPDGIAVSAMAVTAVDNTNGTWQYTTDNGVTWTAFGAVTDASSRLLDGTLTGGNTVKIRFLPTANYSGSATLTFRAWDLTSGTSGSTADTTANGGSSAFSIASDTASISITAVNDAPTLAAGSGAAEMKAISIGNLNGLEGASATFPPKVVSASNGERYVIAWTDMPTTTTVNVKAQVFDRAGAALTSVITVTNLAFNTARPITIDVGMDSAGRFAVVYDTVPSASSGGLDDIAVRRYEADGTPYGSAQAIGTSNRVDGTVSISLSASGRIIVSYDQATSNGATHRFNYTLFASFENLASSTSTSISSVGGAITTDTSFNADGNVLIAGHTAPTTSSVSMRIAGSSGSVSAATVITYATRMAPSLINVRNSSTWRVIYIDVTSGTTNLMMRAASAGALLSSSPVLGSAIVVVTGVSDQFRPSGVVDVDGLLTVAYGVPGTGGSISAKIGQFDASGAAVGLPLTPSANPAAAFYLTGGGGPGDGFGLAFSRQTSVSAGANTAVTYSLDLFLSSLGAAFNDTAAADTFANYAGQLHGYDVEGSTLTYSLAGASTGATIGGVAYSLSKSSPYGVLYLNETDGKYVFVPDAAALNALNAAASNVFSVSASDGQLSATQDFTVSIEAVNDVPVTSNDSFTRPSGAFKISVASLLSNDSDAESEALTLTSYDSASADGGSVSRAGPWLLFTPNTASADTFSYTVSDGHGGSASGTVTITAAVSTTTQTKNILNITPDGADQIVAFAGIPGTTYTIQYTTSLSGTPVWTDLGSEVAGSDGLFTYRDVAPGGGSRFYRTIVP